MNIHDERDAYVIHDGSIILDVNAAFCRLFRCERDQVVDRSLFDLIADEDLKHLGRLRMGILTRTGRNLPDVLYSFLRFDGSIFWGEGHTTGTDRKTVYESRIKLLNEV